VTVTDESNCTTTCTEVILEEGDDRDPLVACPQGEQIECDEEIIIFSTLEEFRAAGGTASDDRELDPTSFSFSMEISSESCPEEITVTYSIADLCGNTGLCTQIFERFDTDPPMIDCPNDTVAVCSVDEGEIYLNLEDFISAGGVASDKCDLDTASFSHISDVSDGIICPETITRTYSIADACGNTAVCTLDIVVNDTEEPIFVSPPENITVSCEDIPDEPEIVTTDNCDNLICTTEYAISETNQGAGSSSRVIGAPDGLYSIIAFGDWQILEFESSLTAGTIINIVITRHNNPGRVEIGSSTTNDINSFTDFIQYGNTIGSPTFRDFETIR